MRKLGSQNKKKSPSGVNARPSALVTGGAGFIGSNFCRCLLERGFKVYAVDNLITGFKGNISPLLRDSNFHFFKLDINQNAFFRKFSGLRIEQIYHFACPTGVPNIHKLAEEMLSTCSIGTSNVLKLAKMHKAKLLFTSTSEVYGQAAVSVQRESYNGNVDPVGPRSPYEEGKRFSESLTMMYIRKYGIDAKIVRLFNTYGPGMSLEDQRVIPQFMRMILRGEKVRIYGDGRQLRTFLYIDDLISAIQLVMDKGRAGEVYNIGGDKQIPIKKLADLALRLTNKRNGIAYMPHFVDDHRSRKPSLKKINALGWRQNVTLEEGLKKMIEIYGIRK